MKKPKTKRNRPAPSRSVQRLVRRLDALMHAGQMCSNVCYNLAQRDYIPQDDAWSMTKAYKAWDAAVNDTPAKPPNAKLRDAGERGVEQH